MGPIADPRLDAVRNAVRSVHDDPPAALAAALEVLADIGGQPDKDPEIVATAAWAAGLAQRDLGNLEAAGGHLRRAVQTAHDAGLQQLEGNARSSLALVHAYRGDTDAALAEAGHAAPLLEGADRARVEMQRALVQQRLGDLELAIQGYNRALPALRAAGDRVAEVRLLSNRGLAHAYRGAFDAGIADLHTARRTAVDSDQRFLAAGCTHNIGFVFGRRGDIPRALRWFDRAAAEFEDLRVASEVAGNLATDRAETLLRAGLTAEALETATHALALTEGGANVVEEAEARLLVARAALAERDFVRADTEARRAAEAFAAQHREGWVVRAQQVRHEAASGAGGAGGTSPFGATSPIGLAEAALALAPRLEAYGWAEAAAALRVRAATRLLDNGRPRSAARAVSGVAAPDRVETAAHRTLAWHAEALRRVIAGDRDGARAAIAEGLAVVDAHRATLAATDLRVRASGLGAGLAALALRLAVEAGDVPAMLRWAEAWKAGNLIAGRRAAAVAGLDDVLAHARAVQADLRRAVAEGDDTEPLHRRLLALEEEVRDRSRVAAPGPAATALSREPDVGQVADRSDGLLIEYVIVDDQIHAVWFHDGTLHHDRCGSVAAATLEMRSARLSLHRLAHAAGTRAALGHAEATLAAALRRLDDQLLPPLHAAAADAPALPVTLVPTGPLHGVPWSGLPSLWDRTTLVTPSLRLWLTARSTQPRRAARPPLVVAGPGLPGAAAEVAAVGARWPGARILTGAGAGVAAVLEQLNAAAVAHIAAHGRLRADNPLFSALTLHDGDLTVYDLERLDRVPETLVLSACDVGASVVHPGDELLGVAATLLARGARSVVAPSVPVADDATAELMTRVHDHLAAGAAPQQALARARVEGRVDDVRHRAAAISFVCLGT